MRTAYWRCVSDSQAVGSAHTLTLTYSRPDTISERGILDQMKAHAKFERLAGREIHPAAAQQEVSVGCKIADDRTFTCHFHSSVCSVPLAF